jgi:glyoxylase-like metal-dependent hydrolase (beta-lactamase superfamily II)
VLNGETNVAEGVWRLGHPLVNFYLLEEQGRLTLVDTGLPTFWAAVPPALNRLGFAVEAIDAVLLTHAHSDHAGSVPAATAASGATAHVHADDGHLARTGKSPRRERGLLGYLWRPSAVRSMAFLLRNGITRAPRLEGVEAFADGDRLDVPGRPSVLHLPGHTRGSAGFVCPDRGIVFSGDALVTRNLLTGRRGPQLLPRAFTEDSELALASLDRIAALDVGVVLPGHGDPWVGPPAEAVAAARAAGLS